MNEERIKISQDLLSDGFGLIAASGYINNEGGQAIADAANKLMDQGCKTLLIDLDGTRIINSIGVSILLEILEKLQLVELSVERSRLTGLPLERVSSSVAAFDFL